VPPAWRFSEPAASSASPSGTENSDRIDDGTFEVVTFLGDEIRGLAKSFGGIRALSGVDVSIERGTVHGLIGPNGSGKSTFVNLVTGVYALNLCWRLRAWQSWGTPISRYQSAESCRLLYI
jgi:ABC-type multidrug transport system fused ATPase/permease subunit